MQFVKVIINNKENNLKTIQTISVSYRLQTQIQHAVHGAQSDLKEIS